jgi:putative sterol carrier protein
MAVKFLSEEWAQAVTRALNSHEGFKSAITGVDLAIQFNVTDAPAGDVPYYFKAAGGSVAIALGETESPDITVTNDYETAVAISKGELNTQAAFMSGKLKAAGNLAKLMMHTNVITQWGAANASVDVEY